MDGFSPVALNPTQRTALHYEIAVASTPSNAPAQSLASIVKAFADASAKGEAVWRRGAMVFEIVRARFNKAGTRAILLIQHKDGEAAEAMSAHLVIDLAPSADKSSVYHAILEQASGLTKARLEQGMQGLARRLCEFYFKDASRMFKQAHPRLSFTPFSEGVLFTLERARSACEQEIRPDLSVKLDVLLKQRVTRLAA